MKSPFQLLHQTLHDHLAIIYREIDQVHRYESLSQELIELMRIEDDVSAPDKYKNHWDQRDAIMITYGDSFLSEGEKPLRTLKRFMDEHCEELIPSIHVLPFFPYSSDDGFSVIDFSSVNESLGDWSDIQALSDEYRLMSDLVINHCSSRGPWFQNFISGREPGASYFFTADPSEDLSDVVRPRTSSLLRETDTENGVQHVWCTFSHDQVDLDFRNPEVLKQFVSIVRQYLDMGVKIFRLDAIAFIWKKLGTNCLNLEETHEIVRLFRTLIEHAVPDAIIITETNIPNRENLSYFGNNNEAHWIYNFSLPPLLVNTLITGSSHYLKQWMMTMPPANNGTTYFNFIASHDGIGLRPVEGLLSDTEVETLVETMQSFGGRISWRALSDGQEKPYEVNIALFDALKGTTSGGPDEWQFQRFICAHTIMLALEGVPAFYVHSLVATENDHHRVETAGYNRAINRHKWDYNEISDLLADETSHNSKVFKEIKRLISVRSEQKAFHPNATQFTMHLGDNIFAFWRQSLYRDQSIFCISNIDNVPHTLSVSSINLVLTHEWMDLITGKVLNPDAESIDLEPYQTLWLTNV